MKENIAHSPTLTLPPLRPGQSYRFHAMVKPGGAQCNLACSYCFYLHKEELLHQGHKPRMSDALLAEHIRQYIEAQTGDEVVFSWQGGEPTLMGLDFFRRVVELQQHYKKPGQTIENDLQTNGVLINEAWASFLKQHKFLVGLSIDGPAALHDRHRYNKGGAPTHSKVMRAASLFHKHRVPFSAICVVNRDNAGRPLDVYRYLRDEVRPRLIQFIPAVELKEFHSVAPGFWDEVRMPVIGSTAARPGQVNSVIIDWSVEPEGWGRFLTRIWDEWLRRDFGKVFVDQFEDVISILLGRGSQRCVTSMICGKGVAIEHNGDVYACDHYVYPEYRLGNIADAHEGDLAFSDRQRAFAFAKSEMLPTYCKSCPYLQLCWGLCPKDRFLKTPDGERGMQYLCTGIKFFYAKAVADIQVVEARLNKILSRQPPGSERHRARFAR